MKIYFFPPNKTDLLVYDRHSIFNGLFNALFKNVKNYSILDVRYESINVYILFLSLLKFNFCTKDFKNIYKTIYIQHVKPKIVYTSIDNNPAFFNLKNLYPNALYISDQNGIAKAAGQKWPNYFFKYCAKFNKTNVDKLKSDITFTFNENDKKWMSKIIQSNIYALGNSITNNIIIKKKIKKKKIIFINSGLFKETINQEIKIFDLVKKYSDEKNYKLTLMSRKDKNSEMFYRGLFGNGQWHYQARNNPNSSYSFLKNSSDSIIIFSHTTLGFESLAIGFKCVIFLHKLAKLNADWKNSSNGFFWTDKLEYKNASKIIDRVINCSEKKWKKISKKISNNFMIYDKKNQKKIKIINSFIKKK
jgi:surface carbohydrate biosynthesis protein